MYDLLFPLLQRRRVIMTKRTATPTTTILTRILWKVSTKPSGWASSWASCSCSSSINWQRPIRAVVGAKLFRPPIRSRPRRRDLLHCPREWPPARGLLPRPSLGLPHWDWWFMPPPTGSPWVRRRPPTKWTWSWLCSWPSCCTRPRQPLALSLSWCTKTLIERGYASIWWHFPLLPPSWQYWPFAS